MATPLVYSSVIEAGDLLDGKYRFGRELGRGAMGTVWTAVHESLGQHVAIKIISPEHAGSSELRSRFEREARAAAQLRSRFVVSVFDHGTTQSGLPYIVMEYLEGETLEERVVRLGKVPLAEAFRVTRHVARGLAAAHARGIVHRDLKPGNIFIVQSDHEDADDWTAKILDFGVAKMEDFSERSTTRTGTVIGTPLYMSPEQVKGSSAVDARADLYSLGMVFFNMLTGGFAFDGQSFGDLLISICTDDLPLLSSRAPQVSPAVDAWFAKACAKDPNFRFQSAEELARALDLATSTGVDGMRSISESSAGTAALLGIEPLAATFASNDTSRGGTARNLIDSDGGSAVTVSRGDRKGGRLVLYAALALLLLGCAGALSLILSGGGAEPPQANAAPPTMAPAAPGYSPAPADSSAPVDSSAPSNSSAPGTQSPPSVAPSAAPLPESADTSALIHETPKGPTPDAPTGRPAKSSKRWTPPAKAPPVAAPPVVAPPATRPEPARPADPVGF